MTTIGELLDSIPNMSEEADIRWGMPSKSGNKRYVSFFSDGTEYRLYDNVQVFDESSLEPHIGKIIKLWEADDGIKMVLIRWYLKREDILQFNPSDDPREVYLAFGKGKGVTNENDLEVVCGKCKILCISKNKLNPQPSEADLEAADYYFKSIFNVDLQHISPVENIPAKNRQFIAYNKPEWVSGSTASIAAKDKKHPKMHEVCTSEPIDSTPDKGPSGEQIEFENLNAEKTSNQITKLCETMVGNAKTFLVKDDGILKKGMRTENSAGEQLKSAEQSIKRGIEKDDGLPHRKPWIETEAGEPLELAEAIMENHKSNVNKDGGLQKKRTTPETRRIFKPLPWEDNLEQGIMEGKVLLLQNLDPVMTSEDVCEIMKREFEGFSDAKVLPQEKSCPSAKAVVIFNTQLNAEKALDELDQKCLVVVTDQRRPIIASKLIRQGMSTQTKLHGHLELEKLMLSRNIQTENHKRVVATSHSSQPNTIEYEMAMEWVHLNEISEDCRRKLFQRQKKEFEDLSRNNNKKDEPTRAKNVN